MLNVSLIVLKLYHFKGYSLCSFRKEHIKAIFQTLRLKITIVTNLTNVGFLDVTFNLHNESYHPY